MCIIIIFIIITIIVNELISYLLILIVLDHALLANTLMYATVSCLYLGALRFFLKTL